MRQLLPDSPSSPTGTLQRSPHAVPATSQDEPGLLYSISPALELQQATGSRSLSRAASSRSRAGSMSRPTGPPPRPPPLGDLGAVPKKKKTVEETPPLKAIAPPVGPAPAQPSAAVTGIPPPPPPPVPENVMSFPVHSLTRRSAPSRGVVAAARPPIVPRPALFEIYKNSLLAGMAAGNIELHAPPAGPRRGVVGRLPAVGGGQLADVLADRRRVMAFSDGDDTDN